MADVFMCEITSCERIASEVYSITVRSGEIAKSAQAGQFLHIKCGHTRLLRRPISICSVMGDTVRFVFEVKGEGTKWLAERKLGQTLDILGPLGNGFRLPDGKAIIVGGGIGAPPMLFAARQANSPATAILGFRDKGKVILEEDFNEVCSEVVIMTEDGSYGMHGMVTAPLENLLVSGGYDAVLSCGPVAMHEAVASLCLRYDIPCQVSLEERMGCGVGACLVCVCSTVKDGVEEMSRICTDGPVFDARTVWS